MTARPKIILAFDTAMGGCGCAIYDNVEKKTLTSYHEAMHRGQAERLMPMIDQAVKDGLKSFADIDLITCTIGPGAFTGLRLSMATAKALSLSLNIPVVGVSTLEAIKETYLNSQSYQSEAHIFVCLETKRQDYYGQIFSPEGALLEEPTCYPSEKIKEILKDVARPLTIIGDANTRLLNEHPNLKEMAQTVDLSFPDCTMIAQLAAQSYEETAGRLQNMTPLYLRGADVSFPATRK